MGTEVNHMVQLVLVGAGREDFTGMTDADIPS